MVCMLVYNYFTYIFPLLYKSEELGYPKQFDQTQDSSYTNKPHRSGCSGISNISIVFPNSGVG